MLYKNLTKVLRAHFKVVKKTWSQNVSHRAKVLSMKDDDN